MSTIQSKPAAHEVRGFDLIGLTVRDGKSAIAFYRDVLGLRPTGVNEEGQNAEFELADGTTFGIWQPDREWPTGFGVMFSVEDAKAAFEAMRKRGAEISDPLETPVCFMSFGKDPEGNTFVIHQRKNADENSFLLRCCHCAVFGRVTLLLPSD